MILDHGTKLGSYEILEPPGADGVGEVYRARQQRMGREVAIKVSAERCLPETDVAADSEYRRTSSSYFRIQQQSKE